MKVRDLFLQQCPAASAGQRCSSLRRRPLQNAADECVLEHEALESIGLEWPVSLLLVEIVKDVVFLSQMREREVMEYRTENKHSPRIFVTSCSAASSDGCCRNDSDGKELEPKPKFQAPSLFDT